MPPAPAGVPEKSNADSVYNKKEKKQKKSAMIFVNELKARLDCYFRIVVRNIRDTVPRLIGHFLVRIVQNKLQIELFKRLNKMFEAVNRSMGEPQTVIQERKALRTQLETLEKAERVLTRDPEITNMISTTDDELLIELRQEKAEEANGKKVDQTEVIEKCMRSVIPNNTQNKPETKPAPAPAPIPKQQPTTQPVANATTGNQHKPVVPPTAKAVPPPAKESPPKDNKQKKSSGKTNSLFG